MLKYLGAVLASVPGCPAFLKFGKFSAMMPLNSLSVPYASFFLVGHVYVALSKGVRYWQSCWVVSF